MQTLLYSLILFHLLRKGRKSRNFFGGSGKGGTSPGLVTAKTLSTMLLNAEVVSTTPFSSRSLHRWAFNTSKDPAPLTPQIHTQVGIQDQKSSGPPPPPAQVGIQHQKRSGPPSPQYILKQEYCDNSSAELNFEKIQD